MFVVYNCLLSVLAPIWVLWMLWRTRARKEKPIWAERRGDYAIAPRKDRQRVWIHAVSVGEVMAVLPILRAVRERLPDHEIVLSVTTSTGHQTARERAVELVDHLVYLPIDVARFTLNAIQRVQPSVVAIMETELWMNFLWAAKVFDCRTLLVNGRISDRSFRRSRFVRFFYRAMLKNMDRCLMQAEVDVERILALGAKRAEAFGNCKFDQAVEGLDADRSAWREKLGLDDDRPVVVIGSTRGEMEPNFVLDAIAKVGLGRCRVVHAPRHIESAETLLAEAAKRFDSVGLRSRGDRADYLILDTYGELASVYAAADVAIIGGGFDDLGGQNLIQPLGHGLPVLHGPHMQNFKDVAAASVACGASQVCATPDELASKLSDLLGAPEERSRRGAEGKKLVQANLGASQRYAEAIAAEAREFRP